LKADDHEKHSDLPKHIPGDFPNGPGWQNSLKDARERRNAADYDPYPRPTGHWEVDARRIQREAADLLAESRAYLLTKGCRFL